MSDERFKTADQFEEVTTTVSAPGPGSTWIFPYNPNMPTMVGPKLMGDIQSETAKAFAKHRPSDDDDGELSWTLSGTWSEMATWNVSTDPQFGGWCTDSGYPGYGVSEANARLMAAAPDLLASLQEIVIEWGYPNTAKWHRAKAAIEKATGVSND